MAHFVYDFETKQQDLKQKAQFQRKLSSEFGDCCLMMTAKTNDVSLTHSQERLEPAERNDHREVRRPAVFDA